MVKRRSELSSASRSGAAEGAVRIAAASSDSSCGTIAPNRP